MPKSSGHSWTAGFLRNELVSNKLRDFGLKKGLNHLDAVRRISAHYRSLRRLPGPVAQRPCGLPAAATASAPMMLRRVRYPGIKIHETRIIRLMEALLHGGTGVGGWTAKQIHQTVLTTLSFRKNLRSEPTPLRPAEVERPWPGTRRPPLCVPTQCQRPTGRAAIPVLPQASLRSAGQQPLPPQTGPACRPNSKLEAAYHKADKAIQDIVDLLAAA